MGGVARRAWARNEAALETAAAWNERQAAAAGWPALGAGAAAACAPSRRGGHITMPYLVERWPWCERLVERR